MVENSISEKSHYGNAYPNSRRVYVSEGNVSVPMRQVALSDGEQPVLLYDTSCLLYTSDAADE